MLLVLLTTAVSTKGNVIHSSKIVLNLVESQHTKIRYMIYSKSFKADDIAAVASCSRRSIYAINRNLRCFSSTKAPSNRARCPRSVIPLMLDTLCQHLEEDLSLYLHEIVNFL